MSSSSQDKWSNTKATSEQLNIAQLKENIEIYVRNKAKNQNRDYADGHFKVEIEFGQESGATASVNVYPRSPRTGEHGVTIATELHIMHSNEGEKDAVERLADAVGLNWRNGKPFRGKHGDHVEA
ncbi:hypothetical protein E8E13_008197 [Curvularia kusanoi]|uniref:Uncharacterized protein n=1 Tax=Curvularia kusanoi TaxID=90978 RepID=A0A9P4TAT1_CURKU|nr:hypothetical protein E8E13_008197 [Curvularia kusanoi]